MTVPSLAQAARIFPAVDRPTLAASVTSAVVEPGWAYSAAHTLSSASVRPGASGPMAGTACRVRGLVCLRALLFFLGMTTLSFTSEAVVMVMPPGAV
ncbi:hypothetical protein [Saccharopolyspora phatthalungensis]|uniref:Uncharacterized protein n=1 Tax=Saccharopolyspora phatthalungensis TaxID=664693 RepID=A0A840QBH7_9PSEU|nr:hypothetical protein [Saccharopolyspora phatthalungensis]MBB5155909.1 hypothetical protein [Saccharopolyspora phatthalungensis]